MKKFLFSVLTLCSVEQATAQTLADDAEGKSSIVRYSNSINFDLAKASLSVGYNNYRESKIVKPNQVLWGITASAKNSDGIATLFDEGKFVPESSLRLFVGNLKKIGSSDGPRKYSLLYLAGGINAASFRLYDPDQAGSFDKRFVKTPYRGGFVDVGINYDYKANWLFGGSVGYERANTFDDNLTSKDYLVRTVDTLGKQQLVTETKYTGYTGDFRLYDRANIRTDVLYFKALDHTDFQLAWNVLYTRSYISFDPNAAKSRIDLGTGLNFYNVQKGSFLGGLYLQANDVFNSQKANTNTFGRISFGIVAKYAFKSIANRFNPAP